MSAVLLREKITDEQGNIREMVIWQVNQIHNSRKGFDTAWHSYWPARKPGGSVRQPPS